MGQYIYIERELRVLIFFTSVSKKILIVWKIQEDIINMHSF
jgi:hypothetical protein